MCDSLLRLQVHTRGQLNTTDQRDLFGLSLHTPVDTAQLCLSPSPCHSYLQHSRSGHVSWTLLILSPGKDLVF